MPDGTYGRLSAHNQRFKELRRKKIERRENKIWQNRLNTSKKEKFKIDKISQSVDPEKLEMIKKEIRKKAQAQLRTELYAYIISFVLIGVLVYFIFFD